MSSCGYAKKNYDFQIKKSLDFFSPKTNKTHALLSKF